MFSNENDRVHVPGEEEETPTRVVGAFSGGGICAAASLPEPACVHNTELIFLFQYSSCRLNYASFIPFDRMECVGHGFSAWKSDAGMFSHLGRTT